jgi:prepilin-type N-terminal cleavage/methylation domain-containing protein
MKAHGYSLVEMIVVIGIVSTLLAIGTLQFNAYLRRYRTEAQARMIYAELQKARVQAVYQRRATLVKLYANRFEVYSSTREKSSGAAPLSTTRFDYPIACTSKEGDGAAGYPLDFDANGLAGNWCSICVGDGDSAAAVDSVVISAVRVRLGKRKEGYECKSENIIPR